MSGKLNNESATGYHANAEIVETQYELSSSDFHWQLPIVLPVSYEDAGLLESLSSNGQLYITRAGKDFVLRVEPISVPMLLGCKQKAGDLNEIIGAMAFLPHKDVRNDYKIRRYIRRVQAHCCDCGREAEYEYRFWKQLRCLSCGSSRLIVEESTDDQPETECVNLGPGFAGTAPIETGADGHRWGRSAADDARVLLRLCDFYRGNSDSAGYLSILAFFARDLVSRHDRAEVSGFVDLLRAYGYVLRYLGRRAYSPAAYVNSLAAGQAAAAGCGDPIVFISVMVELGNTCAEFFMKFGKNTIEAYKSTSTALNIVELGLLATETGLEVVTELQASHNDRLSENAGVVDDSECNFVSLFQTHSFYLKLFRGTIMRLAATSKEEVCTALKALPTDEFEELSKELPLMIQAQFLSEYVQDLALIFGEPTTEQHAEDMARLVGKLMSVLESACQLENYKGIREIWCLHIAKILDLLGATHEAHLAYMRAVNLSLHDWEPSGGIDQLHSTTARRREIFASMADLYVRFGWFFEALSLTETYRGMALSYRALSREERSRESFDSLHAHLKAFSPLREWSIKDGKFERAIASGNPDPFGLFEDDYILPGLSDEVIDLFSKCSESPTAIASVEICQIASGDYYCSAVVLGPPQEPARPAYIRRWKLPPEFVRTIQSALWQRTSGFREQRLRQLIVMLNEHVLAELYGLFTAFPEVRRILFVLPGILSNLPLEAALINEKIGHIDCFLMPSIRFGKNLPPYKQPGCDSKLLVLSYGGDDLPNSASEVQFVTSIFPGSVTVLDGRNIKKQALLNELNQSYDHVHIVSHAEYDKFFPEESSIFFSGSKEADSARLTALDVLQDVHFKLAPVITLSACSSSLTSEERTNTWRGLAGSFLGAGARCVIGTRWPVRDEVAYDFIRHYSVNTFTKCLRPLEAFGDAKLKMRGGRLEDWGCFGYLGAP